MDAKADNFADYGEKKPAIKEESDFPAKGEEELPRASCNILVVVSSSSQVVRNRMTLSPSLLHSLPRATAST